MALTIMSLRDGITVGVPPHLQPVVSFQPANPPLSRFQQPRHHGTPVPADAVHVCRRIHTLSTRRAVFRSISAAIRSGSTRKMGVDVAQRGEPHNPTTQNNWGIPGMSVCSADQPVEDQRLDETPIVLVYVTAESRDNIRHLTCIRAPL